MRARVISVNFRPGGSEFPFFAALFRFFSQDFFSFDPKNKFRFLLVDFVAGFYSQAAGRAGRESM